MEINKMKRSLCLEARHTISLETSHQMRSKVQGSLFLPRSTAATRLRSFYPLLSKPAPATSLNRKSTGTNLTTQQQKLISIWASQNTDSAKKVNRKLDKRLEYDENTNAMPQRSQANKNNDNVRKTDGKLKKRRECLPFQINIKSGQHSKNQGVQTRTKKPFEEANCPKKIKENVMMANAKASHSQRKQSQAMNFDNTLLLNLKGPDYFNKRKLTAAAQPTNGRTTSLPTNKNLYKSNPLNKFERQSPSRNSSNTRQKNYLATAGLANNQDATTGTEGFRNAIICAISHTYQYTPIVQQINEDISQLENSVKSFAEYVMQCRYDIEREERKTNKCLEYLKKKDEERRAQQLQQITACINHSKQREAAIDYLTIFIDVDQMPTKAIQYKIADILYPNLYSANSYETKTSAISF